MSASHILNGFNIYHIREDWLKWRQRAQQLKNMKTIRKSIFAQQFFGFRRVSPFKQPLAYFHKTTNQVLNCRPTSILT